LKSTVTPLFTILCHQSEGTGSLNAPWKIICPGDKADAVGKFFAICRDNVSERFGFRHGQLHHYWQ
jgi:hypothetical protein